MLRPILGVVCAVLMTACASSTKPSQPDHSRQQIIALACPDLTPLTDGSFGATTRKLIEVAETYYRCRAAASESAP